MIAVFCPSRQSQGPPPLLNNVAKPLIQLILRSRVLGSHSIPLQLRYQEHSASMNVGIRARQIYLIRIIFIDSLRPFQYLQGWTIYRSNLWLKCHPINPSDLDYKYPSSASFPCIPTAASCQPGLSFHYNSDGLLSLSVAFAFCYI